MDTMNTHDDYFSLMLGELAYAEKKHRGYPQDVVHCSAILNEEAGKLTQACIDYSYAPTPESRREAFDRMEKFSLRVGAMSLRFYNGMPPKP